MVKLLFGQCPRDRSRHFGREGIHNRARFESEESETSAGGGGIEFPPREDPHPRADRADFGRFGTHPGLIRKTEQSHLVALTQTAQQVVDADLRTVVHRVGEPAGEEENLYWITSS